uniref:Transmembrane protein n=1 Tax=Tanacetum cinerariifolium TaxID=118510 RepID=A0A699JZN0_TANCI|nr:transmembrane protein [Tanacetum cinerariifolium]
MAKLLKFKVHIAVLSLIIILSLIILYVAPSFFNVLAYFWPLFLSTALFLVAVVVFGVTSPPSANVSGEKAGEGILDYVAGASDLGEPVLLQPELADEGSTSNSGSDSKSDDQM